MDDFSQLEQQIQAKLAAARARRRENQERLRRQMQESERRSEDFKAATGHLIESIIRPRLEKLAGYFPNARVAASIQPAADHCVCRFAHTADFPASTKLDLAVSADGEMTHVILTYALEILPVFFRFDGHDQKVIPVNAVDDAAIARWVEQKLLAFLDVYLKLQQIPQYRQENLVIDPVCGMRIDKALAESQLNYEGQVYYFCVDECRQKFEQEPARYLAQQQA